MFNLIAYGSLLHTLELAQHGLRTENACPVVVHGFQRSFNQEPSWRLKADLERAVLGVHERAGASFNALLVSGLPSQALASLDQRERGYHRITLEPTWLTPFRDRSLRLSGRTLLYCGKREKRNDSLLPNAEYLELCLQGARQWGRDFQEYFLQSTFVAGQTIDEFLAGRPAAGESMGSPRGRLASPSGSRLFG